MTSNQPDRLEVTDRRTYFAPPDTDTPDRNDHGAGQDAPRSAIGPKSQSKSTYYLRPSALAAALAEENPCPYCGADADFNQIHWQRCPTLEAK